MNRFSAILVDYWQGMKPLLLLAIALLSVAACEENRAADWSQWSRKDALGLRFAVAPDRQVTADETIINIKRSPERRQVYRIELYTEGGPAPVRLGDNRVLRTGDQPAPYRVIEMGAGSGGMEYALLTTKPIKDRTVTIFARIQTEEGVPTFPEVWAVWESLRLAD